MMTRLTQLDADANECETLAFKAMFGKGYVEKDTSSTGAAIAKLLAKPKGGLGYNNGAKGYSSTNNGEALGADMIWLWSVQSDGAKTGCGGSSGTSCSCTEEHNKNLISAKSWTQMTSESSGSSYLANLGEN
ncbi:hypothetical protein ERJ75_001165400 [Trypanosoma vivax]|nr:hypothetical protein TRVL_01999 [Trypanosoma vivax]KAH8609842.1 hypothetical protein ERJ75_001165400 [Trypanosoma vivax]